jgi:hypothetical protein
MDADATRQNLLRLNNGLRFFFQAYTVSQTKASYTKLELIQTIFQIQTAMLAHLDLMAFAQLLQPDNVTLEPKIPDDIQWGIMCQPDGINSGGDASGSSSCEWCLPI